MTTLLSTTELLGELVDPDLGHCSPSLARALVRPDRRYVGIAHRCVLIERSSTWLDLPSSGRRREVSRARCCCCLRCRPRGTPHRGRCRAVPAGARPAGTPGGALRGRDSPRSGCRCAPGPGTARGGRGRTEPVDRPPTRSRSDLAARARQPTQVRTRACATTVGRVTGVYASDGPRRCRLAGLAARPSALGASAGGTGVLARRDASSGADVDPPAGQPGGEPGVLALLADRQRQLVVGHDDPGRAARPGRRSRPRCTLAGDSASPTNSAGSSDQSTMSIFSPCSSVIDRSDPGAHRADAAPLALTPGAVERTAILVRWPGLAGDRADLDRAVGDLRHLQREQLADQVRVGARQRDLRAARPLADRHDVAARSARRARTLPRHLLRRRAGPPRSCRGRRSTSRGSRALLDRRRRRCRPPCRRTRRRSARPRRRAAAAG